MRTLLRIVVFLLAVAPAFSDQPVMYRCYVKVPDRWEEPGKPSLWSDSINLTADIKADGFEIVVNGRHLGSGQHIKVPSGLLRKGVYNVIGMTMRNPTHPFGRNRIVLS
ncbi:MAG: hypothetical protein AAF492_17030, partial [Verrucomicrobiota bacterium]